MYCKTNTQTKHIECQIRQLKGLVATNDFIGSAGFLIASLPSEKIPPRWGSCRDRFFFYRHVPPMGAKNSVHWTNFIGSIFSGMSASILQVKALRAETMVAAKNHEGISPRGEIVIVILSQKCVPARGEFISSIFRGMSASIFTS